MLCVCVCVCVCVTMNPVSAAFTSALELSCSGAFEPIQGWDMLYSDEFPPRHDVHLAGNLYRFERVKDQHARGARGAGARCWKGQRAFEARSPRFTCICCTSEQDSFPSAVLMTLRIAEGMYGIREAKANLSDLASNAP